VDGFCDTRAVADFRAKLPSGASATGHEISASLTRLPITVMICLDDYVTTFGNIGVDAASRSSPKPAQLQARWSRLWARRWKKLLDDFPCAHNLSWSVILPVCDLDRRQLGAVTAGLEQYIFPVHGIPWIPARSTSVRTRTFAASDRSALVSNGGVRSNSISRSGDKSAKVVAL